MNMRGGGMPSGEEPSSKKGSTACTRLAVDGTSGQIIGLSQRSKQQYQALASLPERESSPYHPAQQGRTKSRGKLRHQPPRLLSRHHRRLFRRRQRPSKGGALLCRHRDSAPSNRPAPSQTRPTGNTLPSQTIRAWRGNLMRGNGFSPSPSPAERLDHGPKHWHRGLPKTSLRRQNT